MNFCPECGSKLETTMKFCGNCGHLIQSPARSTPEESGKSSGADSKIILFFQGVIFKTICWILCIIGILWGIASGSLTSSSVPSVGETVRFKLPQANQRRSPAPFPQRELEKTNVYKRAKAAGRVP